MINYDSVYTVQSHCSFMNQRKWIITQHLLYEYFILKYSLNYLENRISLHLQNFSRRDTKGLFMKDRSH